MIALKKIRPLPIGLDLGPRSATMVQLIGKPGQREVYSMAAGEMPFDEDAPPEDRDRETSSALRKLVADHRFKGRNVVSCLSSEELFVQNVRLPQLPPEEVEKVVQWEAEERLPYPLAEAEIRHLLAGQIRQDSNLKQEVILMACHQKLIHRHIGILEQAGLAPVAIDVEPCAILRCLRAISTDDTDDTDDTDKPKKRRAYLNLRKEATTVMFAEEDQILFLKSISSGGRQLDLAVSQHLDLSIEEAARMRSEVTASDELNPDDEIHRSVIDAIRQPLEALASEIELCLRYHTVTFRGKPLEKIIVTGGEASRWLAKFISERLGMVCELGDPFDVLAQRPSSISSANRPWCWTTAMGLSLK